MENRLQNIQEKWMAAVAWLVLLVAMVVSSVHALSVLGGSSFNQLVLAVIQNTAGGQTQLQLYMYIMILLILVGIGVLLMAWFRFAHLTNEVIIALSAPRDDDEPVFSNFLMLADSAGKAEGEGEQIYEAKGSLFGDVLRLLAIAWALFLLVSPFIRFAQ
jgi:hypothetical protein